MAPLGSQGAPWGRHGAHQVPQDRFWLQFGIPNDPKMDQNDSNMGQNDPKIDQNDPKIIKNKRGVGGIGEPIKSAAPWPCARRERRAKRTLSRQGLPGPKDLFLTATPSAADLTSFWRP